MTRPPDVTRRAADLAAMPTDQMLAEIQRACQARAAATRRNPPAGTAAERLAAPYAPPSGVPAWHQRRTLEAVTPHPAQHNAHRAASAFAGAWTAGNPLPKGLGLLGPVGSGKTMIAAALAVTCGEPAGVMFIDQPTLIAQARAAMDHRGDPSPFTRAQQVPLLVLDDLGSTRDTDWRLDEIRTCLYIRHSRARPVVFTSNLPGSELAAWLGERAWSRLRSTVDLVAITGTDHRLNPDQETTG